MMWVTANITKENEDLILEYQRFGAKGRKKQPSDLRQEHRVDIICLQETIRADFSSLNEGDSFEWVLDCCTGALWRDLVGD
jgi:hypothetical protein